MATAISSKGIDFYAYKNIDMNVVTEIDLYPPQKKSTLPVRDLLRDHKYFSRFIQMH